MGSTSRDEVNLFDVLIAGTGPIGAVFGRRLREAGKKVLMIDIGEQSTRRPGDNKKNSPAVQKDMNLFTNTIKGDLHLLSVPPDSKVSNLEPHSRRYPQEFILHGENPDQNPHYNLPEAAVSYGVGGMGSHWTCCIPRQHEEERSTLFTDPEWDALYDTSEEFFKRTDTAFDHSVRQRIVQEVLDKRYPNRGAKSMPLSCERQGKYVEWGSTATILGDSSNQVGSSGEVLFEIRPNTQLVRLNRDRDTGPIISATVKDLVKDEEYSITVSRYVVCAGAVLTPGILFNSHIREEELPALGHYLTEQSMSFCQVVLKRSLIDLILHDPNHPEWQDQARAHEERYGVDPLPLKFSDPDPHIYIPYSTDTPWHCQVHRDPFGYGEIPPDIDQRLVLDFRWFAGVEPVVTNCVKFSDTPTFHFKLSDHDGEICHRMIDDMVEVARHLGGFLPGAEPRYLPSGAALHICGTYRASDSKDDGVVDRNGKVFGIDNLSLGGCGVIPTANACNPTLTAGCFAVAAADQIVRELGEAPPGFKFVLAK